MVVHPATCAPAQRLLIGIAGHSMTTFENLSGATGGMRDRRVGRSDEMEQVARLQELAPWVLVVDDDALAARSAARLITAATGVRVAVVADVDQALRLVTRADRPPAAVILDYDLSGGQKGLTVLLSLRAAGFEVPCAFHTGAGGEARSALQKSRLDDGYPVFDKGRFQPAELVDWLRCQLPGQPAPLADSSHRSGVREKLA